MTKLVINFVNKKHAANKRTAYSNVSGTVCIICNLILAAVKLTVGSLAASVSITADAVNNLFDSVNNIVTLTGTRLSNKPDDKEHPFGHGRVEYVAGIVVAVSIFLVGFEFAKDSLLKIINPQTVRFSAWFVAVLAVTVLVKLWMAYFNYRLYKLTGNLILKGVMQDSLNDCIATTATIVSALISHFFGVKWIDGAIGICVSLFILYSGVEILKSVISPLLGEPPSKEITDRIAEIITESDTVLGIHDLIIHNYGANRIIASADAEVDAGEDIFAIHEIIDTAERKILDELGVIICIHMDPVDTGDAESKRLRRFATRAVKNYNPEYSVHDIRIAEKDDSKYISFDLAVPFCDEQNKQQIKTDITALFAKEYPDYPLDVSIEHLYT